ncbi:MAG: HEAT repeat domain-containing protein [Myxococcota bacterium]|nr:HEAT repeat domain-containing protein [Myxococcota bacterium]
MSSLRDRFVDPLKRSLKRRLAGNDLEQLVQNRNRRRLRWLAEEAEDPVVRFRALRNLAEMLDPEATDLFLGILAREAGTVPAAMVRTAAEGLGRLLHGDSAQSLRRLLADKRPCGVQLAAARSLATIGRAEDWSALRPWLEHVDGPSPLLPDERDTTVLRDTEPGGTRPLVWVLEVIYADKNSSWWTSKAGKWLMSDQPKPRMDADRGADKIVAASHRNALQRRQLEDEDFRRTLLHLGSLARDRDFDRFVDQLRDQQDLAARRSVIQSIGLHGDPRAIPLFEQWLGEVPADQPDLAADLVRGAGRLGWPAVGEAIQGLWSQFEQPAVRLNLLWALGESGGDDNVRFLINRIRARDQDLSDQEFEWAVRAIQRCGVLGREAIRGCVATARAGGGERDRVRRMAEMAGVH